MEVVKVTPPPNRGNTKHGLAHTRPYNSWCAMIARCTKPNDPHYKWYGARGITVCEEWKTFEGFWNDMQEGYASNLMLEREDNNGNYCKGNCKWATRKEQSNNKRNNRLLETPNGIMSLQQAADFYGLERGCLRSRLRRKVSVEELFSPSKKENRHDVIGE